MTVDAVAAVHGGRVGGMIQLTREVRFSVLDPHLPDNEGSSAVNNAWAGWPSTFGLAPFVRLRVTVAGPVDPVTGYLCDINALDGIVRQQAIPITATCLNVEAAQLSVPSLIQRLWERLSAERLGNAVMTGLELWATPWLRYAVQEEVPDMVLMTQQFEFSAAHRLHCPQLSPEENRRVFGKCNNPGGHGHNYIVDVTLAGEPDARTGAVLALPRFEEVVKEHVIDPLDHRHLNEDTSAFREINPTVENIARVVWDMLDPHVAPARLHRVRVWETPKTCAEYGGG